MNRFLLSFSDPLGIEPPLVFSVFAENIACAFSLALEYGCDFPRFELDRIVLLKYEELVSLTEF